MIFFFFSSLLLDAAVDWTTAPSAVLEGDIVNGLLDFIGQHEKVEKK